MDVRSWVFTLWQGGETLKAEKDRKVWMSRALEKGGRSLICVFENREGGKKKSLGRVVLGRGRGKSCPTMRP